MNKLIPIAVAIVVVAALAVAAVTLNNQVNQEPSASPSLTPSSAIATPSRSPTVTNNPTPTATNTLRPTSSPNESAVITFTAPVQLLATSFSSESAQTTTYEVWASASWDPAPYVRYYEVSLNYGNNSKPLQNTWSSANYLEWGSPGNELGPFPWTENKVYVIGPEGVQHPSGQPYRGPYDSSVSGTWLTVKADGTKVFGPNMWDNSKHGVMICGITATFKNDGNTSNAQMGQVASEVQKFLSDYTQGWTVTLKNVS
jgi:hypothetical protein